jgi:5-methylcytosine-specific restriction endonuclease McrA
VTTKLPKQSRLKLNRKSYVELWKQVLVRDGWRCQNCGCMKVLQVHHIRSRGLLGDDREKNLITLCADCHRLIHDRNV